MSAVELRDVERELGIRLSDAPLPQVYVIDADQGVKVGITVDLSTRVRELERGAGQPVHVIRAYNMPSRARAWRVEQDAHWLLRDTRTVGEWFHCHPFDATEAVERAMRRDVAAPLSLLADIESQQVA